jgi:hypothetical protein
MQKESANGRANHRLANGEWQWCSPRRGGRNGEREDIFHRPIAYIGGAEREGLGGSLESATDAGVEPDR